jgi:3-methyladenine DNA glycosylase AlkD
MRLLGYRAEHTVTPLGKQGEGEQRAQSDERPSVIVCDAMPPRRPVLDVDTVVASLKRLASKRTRDDMKRYGIPSDNALGVPMAAMLKLAKQIGRDHDLAAALWKTQVYEARMLASLVDEPDRVSPAQMDQWCRDFDNWGICDTVCFKLFDQSPHAWRKATQWASRRNEFEKRAGFVLMACLALHDKKAADDAFLPFLGLIDRAAADDRNFVKKGADWALRSIARRSAKLKAAATGVSRRITAARATARRKASAKAL